MDGVVAQSRRRRQGQIAVYRAGGERHVLVKQGVVILVSDGHVDGGELGQLQMILDLGAQNPLPMHYVARTIDGAIGVDVRRPAATLKSAEGVASGSNRGHVVARGGQYP